MTKQKNVNRTDAFKDSHTEQQEQFLERLSVDFFKLILYGLHWENA